MTRRRWPSKGGGRHRSALLLLLAGLLLPLAVAPAASADRMHQSGRGAAPALPPRSPVPAASLIPTAAPGGMCQCIADHDRRHIGCLASVDQCKTACGEHYSFVPHAPSCPITAQEQGK